MYDPSIGKESLTTIDVVGVLAGHILFGVAATFLIDWSWIPLSPKEKDRGRSLIDIKRSWGWEEKIDKNENYLISKVAKIKFPVRNGVPILLASEAKPLFSD